MSSYYVPGTALSALYWGNWDTEVICQSHIANVVKLGSNLDNSAPEPVFFNSYKYK